MIKAKELMIGNLVYRDKRDEPVQMILPYFSHLHRLDPIPITEEWLLKFGFERYAKGRLVKQVLLNGRIYFNIINDTNLLDNICELSQSTGPNFGYVECKYVHQLQNLYVALTQKDLFVT